MVGSNVRSRAGGICQTTMLKPPRLPVQNGRLRSRIAFHARRVFSSTQTRHAHGSRPPRPSIATSINEFGVPVNPTWSVRELLDSYPPPTIEDATFEKIHRLSALVPPKEGTDERRVLKKELEDLVKLVNAVRMAEVPKDKEDGRVPDGRIYPIPRDVGLDEATTVEEEGEGQPNGRELLRHSRISKGTAYVLPDLSTRRDRL